MASRQKNAITLFMTVKGAKRTQQVLKQAEAQVGKFGVAVAGLGVKGSLAHKTFTKTTNAIKNIGVQAFTATAKVAALGAAIAGVAAGALAKMTFGLANAAAEAGEVRSLFEQAFTGDALQIMDANVQKLVSTLGLSRSELQQNASLFAVFGTKAGLAGADLAKFSDELLWVSADLTAAFGTSFEEAATAVKSGLSGEIEPLKRFGIIMTEADLAAKAASLGFTKAFKDMTIDEKTLLRAAYIKDAMGFASGQALREADNYATVRRSLSAALKSWQETLGGPLLEPLKGFFIPLRDAGDKWVPKLTEELKEWVPTSEQVTATMTRLLGKVEAFAIGFKQGGLAGGIGAVFGPQAQQLASSMGSILASVGKILKEVGTGFLDVFTPLGDQTVKNGPSTIERIASALAQVAAHGPQLRELGQTAGQLLPTVVGLSGAFVGWSKAVTIIGQVNGSMSALKATATATQGVLGRQAHKGELLRGVQRGRKARAALNVADAAGTGASAAGGLGLLGKGKLLAPFKKLGGLLKGASLGRLIGGITKAVRGLFLVLRANPIGLVITAIIGLIAVFKGMYDNSTELQATVGAAWSALQAIGTTVMQALGAAFTWFNANVAIPFMDWWRSTGSPAFTTALGVMGDIAATVLNTIGKALKWLWENVAQPGLKWMSEVGFPALGNAITAAKAVAEAPINFLTNAVQGIIDAARQGKSWVDGFFNGIKNAALDMWQSIAPIINPVREFFGAKPINLPARVPAGQQAAQRGVGKITANRIGGPVLANRPVLVGERGPELFVPQASGHIVPNRVTDTTKGSRASLSGGVTINIHSLTTTGGRGDAAKFARDLASELDRELARRRQVQAAIG